MTVAVIPARGGSKRIPRKNIRDFRGKPMIAWSIGAAKACGLFERILVSTDDAGIAEVATSYGADAPFVRPAALSGDHAGTTEVVAHAITWLRAHGSEPAEVCCIYATAPFVQAADLVRAYSDLRAGPWQYVFAATTFEFPVFRALMQEPGGGVRMLFPEHLATRSQDLPESIHDAGQFYWGRADAWVGGKSIFDAHSRALLIPRWRVQDIDTMDDWRRAELLHRGIEERAADGT